MSLSKSVHRLSHHPQFWLWTTTVHAGTFGNSEERLAWHFCAANIQTSAIQNLVRPRGFRPCWPSLVGVPRLERHPCTRHSVLAGCADYDGHGDDVMVGMWRPNSQINQYTDPKSVDIFWEIAISTLIRFIYTHPYISCIYNMVGISNISTIAHA